MSEKTFFQPATPSDLEREDLVSLMGYNYLTCLDMALEIFGDLHDPDHDQGLEAKKRREDARRDREIFIQDTYRELNRLYNVRRYRCISCDCSNGGDCDGQEDRA